MIYIVAEILLIANNFERLAASKKQIGTIYLIHFEEPIGNLDHKLSTAQHYIGWSSDLDKRLVRHQAGQGSSIMRYVQQSGIPWSVNRSWNGTRDDERMLKNQKNAKRYCSICSTSPIEPPFASHLNQSDTVLVV